MGAGIRGWAPAGCVLVAALGRAAAHAETPASHAASLASVPPAFALQRPAEAPARPVEPHVHATWLWAAAQLVPSPQWTILDGGGVWAGARWQVTPFLWSLRMRRGLSPFRFFVVEPNVRSWGSFEVFLAPEVSAAPGPFERKLLGRAGARVYAPLAHAGEYLSMSIGGSAFVTSERAGGAIEVGLYTFAGMAGAQVTHAPDPRARSTTVTLALRYF